MKIPYSLNLVLTSIILGVILLITFNIAINDNQILRASIITITNAIIFIIGSIALIRFIKRS